MTFSCSLNVHIAQDDPVLKQHIQHSPKGYAPVGPISTEQCWTRLIYTNSWKTPSETS